MSTFRVRKSEPSIEFDGTQGSTDSLVYYLDNPIISALPMTMACWFRRPNTSTTCSLMTVSNGTSDTNNYWELRHVPSNGNCFAAARDGGTIAEDATTDVDPENDHWGHVAGVFRSNTDRDAYFNGVAGTQSTVDVPTDPATMDRISLGVNVRWGGSTEDYIGQNPVCIAMPAIWDAELSQGELLALANGAHPRSIRPRNLVFCPDLAHPLARSACTRTAVLTTPHDINGIRQNSGFAPIATRSEFMRFVPEAQAPAGPASTPPFTSMVVTG